MPQVMYTPPVEETFALPPTRVGAPPELNHAQRILRAGFTIIPIVAGADKFLHRLVDWQQYLAPTIIRLIPVESQTVMAAVGIVEILAGALVFARPRLGGYVVAVWLWAIIGNLLLVPGYYDIALRDFGLSLGALALAMLSPPFGRRGQRDAQHAVGGISYIV